MPNCGPDSTAEGDRKSTRSSRRATSLPAILNMALRGVYFVAAARTPRLLDGESHIAAVRVNLVAAHPVAGARVQDPKA